MSYKLNEHIKRYVDMVEQREVAACADQWALVKLVRKAFREEDIYTDGELLEQYLGLAKYFPFERVFPWEAFCIALHLCTFWRRPPESRTDNSERIADNGGGANPSPVTDLRGGQPPDAYEHGGRTGDGQPPAPTADGGGQWAVGSGQLGRGRDGATNPRPPEADTPFQKGARREAFQGRERALQQAEQTSEARMPGERNHDVAPDGAFPVRERALNREPRWPDLFLCAGRGAGKDGFIALCAFALISPYHKIKGYDVDICANSEDQAQRPMKDIIAALDDPRHAAKLRKYYHRTMELVRGLKNGGTVKGRTSNPKTKDGMRSGMVVFNETHQYADYRQMKVFLSGRGKVAHPRTLIATTRGDVRDGPLDDDIRRAEAILKGAEPDTGFLPMIFRLDEKDDVHNPEYWVKANPSLPYLPALRREIEREYVDWQGFPEMNGDFLTKRMNLPQTTADVAVTDWENIAATALPLPDLRGRPCVAGLDYASTSDFVSVNLHFRDGDTRYDINHSWLCLRSKDLSRIQAPWREWSAGSDNSERITDNRYGDGRLLTLVDAVEVHPDLIAAWLLEMGRLYNIRGLALDNYRYALVARSLEAAGFDVDTRKNIRLVRPSDIMKVQPVIASAFANRAFVWGENPVLRWAANNTKLVRSSRAAGVDTGNFIYAKIEARSRKTDPFMALVASMTIEDMLPTSAAVFDDLPVIVA
jgi:phage terminase large subunit-like protein